MPVDYAWKTSELSQRLVSPDNRAEMSIFYNGRLVKVYDPEKGSNLIIDGTRESGVIFTSGYRTRDTGIPAFLSRARRLLESYGNENPNHEAIENASELIREYDNQRARPEEWALADRLLYELFMRSDEEFARATVFLEE